MPQTPVSTNPRFHPLAFRFSWVKTYVWAHLSHIIDNEHSPRPKVALQLASVISGIEIVYYNRENPYYG